MELLKIYEVKGKIELLTGLHIGASTDSIEIGGMDNPIIKDPFTDEPYIPGSTIKGKLRSIMEWVTGKVLQNNGEPCNCGECEICRVFGVSSSGKDKDKALKRGPTRLIVRDAFLDDYWREEYKRGVKIIEEKYENSIDRITASANPRPLERVVPGVTFNFSMVYQIIDIEGDEGKEDEKNFKEVVLKGLSFLEKSYLGGGGSRGNGQITFKDLKLNIFNIKSNEREENIISLPEV